MGQVSRFHGEVDFSGEPFFADLAEQCGDEAEERGLVGEEGGDAGPALEFLIDAFKSIAGSQAALMGEREGEDGEALWDVFLQPSGEPWRGLGVRDDELVEAGLGGGEIRAVEDGTDVGGDAGAHVEAWNVSLGILLEMELAALPGNGGEDGGAGGGETGMGIADDEGEAVKAARLEGSEEGAPVGFGLAESGADAENRTSAARADADGNQHGAIQELAALPDLFVTGIEDYIGTAPQRTFPPDLEFGIELGGAGADLGGTHGVPAEFLDDFGDFAGGDALNILTVS